jgi:hypothetical protein
VVITNAELQDATVSLAGIVEFTVENPAAGVTSWTFTGERAGDLLEGQHTLTRGSQSQSGSWSGLRP